MSSQHQISTQPFDSAEIQAILAQMKRPHSPSRPPEPRREDYPETLAVTARADIELAALTEAFNAASLASPPNTRLVISSSRWANFGGSSAVRLPSAIGAWDLVSVVQRTHDVHFAVSLPIESPPDGPPNPHFTPINLRFNVYYDPGNDSCVLGNRINQDILLSRLGAEAARIRVEPQGHRAVSPGLWRLSLINDRAAEQHILDLLILRRQFTVRIYEGNVCPTASGKRKAQEDFDVVSKRPRQEDETEILLVPKTKPPPHLYGRTVALALTPMASYEVSSATGGTPLICLNNGDTATVQASQSRDDRAEGPAIYELSRLERVAVTCSASLFTARHTALAEDVVAKVIKYEGKTAEDLVKCARNWAREARFLQKLSHRNIMSLKSLDGRLFALYVENLPSSLNQGLNSPFAPSDANTILRDMSSALAYLKLEGIAHNDIKPANITYSLQRGAVLIDFGLATHIDEPMSRGGTPWYMPPEFAYGTQSRNVSGDIWALGVTMLYVLHKIPLPDMVGKGWLIRDVMKEASDARQKMEAWLTEIEDVRKHLDHANVIERQVYKMLEPRINSRVQAAQNVTAFEEAKPSATATMR